ncbi:MAG TPA: adenylate/guanylate cyclase domain-containing protein [Candidatus Binatia bacterium]|jgi:adenylate cyclase|nr:adenylate/guanylate cyclase domain-containing protein [Candidatus Binatia bacterium]
MDPWADFTRAIIGEPELTPAEVAAAAGIDLADARRLWRALGFSPVPDDQRFFTASDVEVLHAVLALRARATIDPAVVVQLARATGQAAARLAEAQVAVASDQLTPATHELVPILERFLTHVWRRHLLAAGLRQATSGAGAAAGGRTLVVGFADLVGFTALSQQLDDRELAALIDRFEALVFEHVPEHRGRVVKMIGDEVLFSAETPVDAAEIALSLVASHHADPALPDLRVGLSMGPVLSWEGDLLGPTVNRASRIVALAREATVVVSGELAEQLRPNDAYVLRDMRPVKLRGIGRVPLSALRRAR